MVWCPNCLRYQPGGITKLGLICCSGCGKVVQQNHHSEEPKDAAAEFDDGKGSPNAGKYTVLAIRKSQGDIGLHRNDRLSGKHTAKKSESFSGIDDAEIASYLLTEGEKRLKKILWDRINHIYLKNQAAKKDMAVSRNANQSKKQKVSSGRSYAGAAPQTSNKNLSSRVNYDKLEELLGQSMAQDKSNKRRAEDGDVLSQTGIIAGERFAGSEAEEEEHEDSVDEGGYDFLF